MRSRYSAYVLGDADYLRATWHEAWRPAVLTLDDGIHWLGLEIIETMEQGDQARVEFEARLIVDGFVDALRERSRFLKVDGRWYYADGEMREPGFRRFRPGRNEPCPCGSGRKFKRCCG
jgi:SEC-C motif-containing protein